MHKLIGLLIVLLLLIIPLTLRAQDISTATPTPVIVEPPPPNPIPDEPNEPPATTPETLLGQLYQLLKDGTYIVWAAAGVVIIVGLLKMVGSVLGVKLEGNSAILLTLIIQVAVWLAYATANYFGQGEAFKTWYLQIVDVLRSLLPLAGAIFAGHVLYTKAHAVDVPLLGYKPKVKSSLPPVSSPVIAP